MEERRVYQRNVYVPLHLVSSPNVSNWLTTLPRNVWIPQWEHWPSQEKRPKKSDIWGSPMKSLVSALIPSSGVHQLSGSIRPQPHIQSFQWGHTSADIGGKSRVGQAETKTTTRGGGEESNPAETETMQGAKENKNITKPTNSFYYHPCNNKKVLYPTNKNRRPQERLFWQFKLLEIKNVMAEIKNKKSVAELEY